jgi:hypothetical protein
MAALTTSQEYQAVREAIQQMTTLDENGARRDAVSIAIDGVSVTYAAAQLQWLQAREAELANRLCNRNRRKRVSPDFSYPT